MAGDVRLDVVLRSHLPSLSPSEARVAQVFLDSVRSQTNPRVAQVAEKARTSTATVVRLYQRLGYDHFADFWIDLTLSSRSVTQEDPPLLAGRLERGASLDDVVTSLVATEQRSLADTASSLDLAALRRAVELVGSAGRVDVFGVGASALVGADLRQKLGRIGITVTGYEGTHEAWTAVAAAAPGTVVVAISHSGETQDVLELVRIARASGCHVVAITNVVGSSLSSQADVALLTAAREAPFRAAALSSRIAQLLMVDCLFLGVALATYDTSMAALRRTFAAIDENESARVRRPPRAGRRRAESG